MVDFWPLCYNIINMLYKKGPISPARRQFRRILGLMAILAFLFASVMSYFYVGHREGRIAQKDIAPTVFATDIYLYQTRAYWSAKPEKYEIAEKLVRLGFFDAQYYYAGREMMGNMARNGYAPAEEFMEKHFNVAYAETGKF